MIEPTMMEGTESFILLSKVDIVPVVMMKMIAVFSFYVVGHGAKAFFVTKRRRKTRKTQKRLSGLVVSCKYRVFLAMAGFICTPNGLSREL